MTSTPPSRRRSDDKVPYHSLLVPAVDTDSAEGDESGETSVISSELCSDNDGGDEEQFATIQHKEANDNNESEGRMDKFIRIIHQVWIQEDRFIRCGQRKVIESVAVVRFLKFLVMTVLSIIMVHEFVRVFDYEHDTNYNYADMMVYDGNAIILDAAVFFIVGRLYKHKRAVDHLAWVSILVLASLYNSVTSTFLFLQHALTLYEVHCTWPWKLFVFLAVVLALATVLSIRHAMYAIRTRQLVLKLLEMAFFVFLFLVPQFMSSQFHFHHWFAGWLLGMHANFDTWWSRATMAWCWGNYINGIAVWGRDPLQSCGYAFYMSQNQGCSYLACFAHAEIGPNNETQIVYNEPEVPDWRYCT